VIRFDLNNVPEEGITPGSSFSVLMLIDDPEGDTSLAGYTLEVDIDPDPGSTGSAAADIAATNFFPSQNVIVQGGNSLHPHWSFIRPPDDMDAGVFVQALTATLGTVSPPIPGVSDALAEIWIDVPLDATGSFTIGVNVDASTVTASVDGGPVGSFFPSSVPLTFDVVPEPATFLLLASGVVCIVGRRRRVDRL
jgi:hypothetical protein